MQQNTSLQRLLNTFAFIALGCLAMVVFMGKSYETSLQALDSTTHAMLSLEVTHDHDGLGPVLPMKNFVTNKRLDETFNDHPFALFYLSGKVMRFFGPDAWSARLVPTLFSVGCVMLLAWLGTLLYSVPAGLLAGLILMTSYEFILIGSRFHLDTAMIFFILLSFVFWWKKMPVATGIAAGVGLWMKTPVVLLVFPSAFFALLLTRQLSFQEFKKLFFSGLIALAVGSMVWLATGAVGGWDLVRDYWTRQVWGTAVGGRNSGMPTDYWMGINLLKSHYYPWLPLLLISLVAILFCKRWKNLEVALPLCGAIIIELVISIMRFKYYWYFLPVFPFLALIVVDLFRDVLKKREKGVAVFFMGAGLIVPTFFTITPVDFGPETFPAIRKFSALIQNYGDCNDQILFVDGGQPFGSVLDSIYELSFYTERKILQGVCAEVPELLSTYHPQWIVISGQNYPQCMSVLALHDYPVHYQFGYQHLLSRVIDPKEMGNLTPLARELKPVRDCKSVSYPNNFYFPAEGR